MVRTFQHLVDSFIHNKYCFRSPGLRSFCTPAADKPKPPRNRESERRGFIDTLRIHLKAGAGGDGFPKKNGLGGKGGDIIVVGSDIKGFTLKNVYETSPSKRFKAKNGEDGKLFCLFGANGKSLHIPCPLGVTVVSEHGHKLGEINEPDDKVVAAQGGEGGSSFNGFCGQKGQAHTVTLDLKLIADVGFVGFPNAGKSTLLRAISRAKPRIASYPFTTVRPNIGVIEYKDERQIALADLPGLIEGAHLNMGMGHKFLKHVERTKVLLFVVDLHGFQLSPKYPMRSALETILLLNREIELYQQDLTQKPAILALNKIDKPDSYPILEKVRDTLYSDEAYEEYIHSLPEEFRPVHRIKFENIIPISAAKDIFTVQKLKEAIRKSIDVNHDYDELEREKAFPVF